MNATSTLFALVLTTVPVLEQNASYTLFGAGCPGSGEEYACVSNNAAGSTPNGLVYLGKTPQVNPVATATITVAPFSGWHRATFSTPVAMASKERFFLSYDAPNGFPPFSYPMVSNGNQSTAYARGSTQAWYTSSVLQAGWAFRVNCIPSSALTPLLGARSLPRVGTLFSFDMRRAAANAPYVLISGLSSRSWGTIALPLSLQPIGANGCTLYASMDFVTAGACDMNGPTSLRLPIPQSSQLLELTWQLSLPCPAST